MQKRRRYVFTTHSADVREAINISGVRLVRSESGVSVIERVAAHSAAAVREETLHHRGSSFVPVDYEVSPKT